ncbi:SWIM zinc finger family protein [Halococcus hamelinensis]|uniref:SWIM zinc finger family protein n=1 Tax=Halococcus hamelinensis TaxID=332168 RepID=UPI000A926ADB|nr:SWIM zinc finger family protein [Halococcus hamelinensis]
MTRSNSDNESGSVDEQRAQWEAFEFRVPVPGAVRVENTSYGDDSGEHVYVVSVESGIPFDCTCPSWKYHNPEDGCKHMLAVENQPAVLMASSSDESPVLADGGERQ